MTESPKITLRVESHCGRILLYPMDQLTLLTLRAKREYNDEGKITKEPKCFSVWHIADMKAMAELVGAELVFENNLTGKALERFNEIIKKPS